jgi:hypothetical protein
MSINKDKATTTATMYNLEPDFIANDTVFATFNFRYWKCSPEDSNIFYEISEEEYVKANL